MDDVLLVYRGFTFYKMANLDNRIANADQLLTQDVEKLSNSIAELYSNLSKVCSLVLMIFKTVWDEVESVLHWSAATIVCCCCHCVMLFVDKSLVKLCTRNSISKIRSVTCHMVVTHHPMKGNGPCLNPSQTVALSTTEAWKIEWPRLCIELV